MKPTALYRHFDQAGRLLYVGIALSPVNRLSEHRASHWSQEICRVQMEWFPTRENALAAELAAIRSERPLHNVVGSTRQPQKQRKPRLVPAVGRSWYCAVDGDVSGGTGETAEEAFQCWLRWEQEGYHHLTRSAVFRNPFGAIFGSFFDETAENWRRIEARDETPAQQAA